MSTRDLTERQRRDITKMMDQYVDDLERKRNEQVQLEKRTRVIRKQVDREEEHAYAFMLMMSIFLCFLFTGIIEEMLGFNYGNKGHAMIACILSIPASAVTILVIGWILTSIN